MKRLILFENSPPDKSDVFLLVTYKLHAIKSEPSHEFTQARLISLLLDIECQQIPDISCTSSIVPVYLFESCSVELHCTIRFKEVGSLCFFL